MIVTEDAARKLWCPLARVFASDGNMNIGPYNRLVIPNKAVDGNPPETRCIGSACMWWEWEVEDARGYCGAARRA